MSSDRSPALAAALSLIFPGLGQIYAGAVRRGLAWTLPTVALILVAIIIVVGKISLAGLVTAEATLALIALQVAFLFYHVAAMFDAYGIAQRQRRMSAVATSGAGAVALAILVVVALLVHAVPIYATSRGNDFLALLFPGRPNVIPSASFTFEPEESIPPEITDSPEPTEQQSSTPGQTASGGPSTTPGQPTPSAPPQSFPPIGSWGDRVNLLLIGSDAGPGRHGGRTDTMILLSVEVTTGKAALFGFPRNMTDVPIEDAAGTNTFDRLWTDPFPPGYGNPAYSLITNLWQYAYENPNKFYTPQESCAANDPNLDQCLGDARAFRATAGAIQNLAGVNINGGVVAVNLEAFRELVDAVGGVWMDVPDAIYDDSYPTGDGVSPHIIDIPEGCNWFDGIYALAYARSRHQDSDYKRMKRQQMVLQAVRRQIDPLSMLPRLDELLSIASNNLWTTIDRNDIPVLAQIASRVDADRLYQVRFTPGAGYPSHLTSTEIRSIRSRVQHIFEQPQPQPSPTPSNPAKRCPAPGETPGPSFNTSPSPKP